LVVVAPHHVGHAHRCIVTARFHTQCAAGDRDLAQIKTIARAACPALHHHQAGLWSAQPLELQIDMLAQGRIQQGPGGPGQQSHPLLPLGLGRRLGMVIRLKHG
jgi:hypothetical protein